MSTRPLRPLHSCPVCNKYSYYVVREDRYYHRDGTENRDCWLAIMGGGANKRDVQLGHPPQLTRIRQASEWLRDYLEKHDGSAPTSDVKVAAAAAGFSETTLKRAKEATHVVANSYGVPRWYLPEIA